MCKEEPQTNKGCSGDPAPGDGGGGHSHLSLGPTENEEEIYAASTHLSTLQSSELLACREFQLEPVSPFEFEVVK